MKSILLVEDQEDLRTTLMLALTAAGYRVRAAANGAEAKACLPQCRPDIVITDILMPDRDGIETIADVRRLISHKIPVVAMSGGGRLPAGHYLNLAGLLGARFVLEKPFSREEFLRTVDRALLAS
jgi:CheY-like chemotaxis protein